MLKRDDITTLTELIHDNGYHTCERIGPKEKVLIVDYKKPCAYDGYTFYDNVGHSYSANELSLNIMQHPTRAHSSIG